ncbi:hypothetical protein SG34_033150 [Thalassomonas viridans]|uniref:Uncharacterized protein n=1 Tax=Thalassomonas viridans TaxID=137584 RepID=A0AAE9ZA29_9GAMM|nr:hypothetical protein [Thalassomonas viridans]WDE08750.1 hypothetical protein SG34_033150 [Thalassomonas viridans]
MFKISITAVAVLLSTGASAVDLHDFGFPVERQAERFAPVIRENICKIFNAEVTAINSYITSNNLPDSLISTNLCSYIRSRHGQIEESGITFRYGIYSSGGGYQGDIIEKVDYTRDAELIILSQEGVTQYLFYVNGDVVLRDQQKTDRVGYVLPGYGASYNPYGDQLLSGVFNRVKSEISVRDAQYNGPEDGPRLSACAAGELEFCVPGGPDNSRYWSLEDGFYPKTSNTNTTLDTSETSSFGFNIGAELKGDRVGPSGGVSVNFSLSNSRTVGRERKVLGVNTVKYPSDIGVEVNYNLSPQAIYDLYAFGYTGVPSSLAISDERLGSYAWRELDITSNASWREYINSQNCTPNTERSMSFSHKLYIERGSYDLDGSGSSARWDYSTDSQYSRTWRDISLSAKTECQIDSDGNYFRTFKPGLLF